MQAMWGFVWGLAVDWTVQSSNHSNALRFPLVGEDEVEFYYMSEIISYLDKSDDIWGQFKYKKIYLSDVYSCYTVQYSSLWVFTHNSIYFNISI